MKTLIKKFIFIIIIISTQNKITHASNVQEIYYVNHVLPLLQRLCPGDRSYQTFEAFVRDGARRTGYRPDISPEDYLTNVWMSIPRYKKAIDELGVVTPKYKPEEVIHTGSAQ